MDGCGGVFNGGFDTVAPDQHAVRCECHGFVFSNRQRHGIPCSFTSSGIYNLQHVRNWVTCRFLSRPARQGFSDDIEIGHLAPDVGAHDRIADGIERDLRALFFIKQCLGNRRALDHAVYCFRQQVAVYAFLE